MSCDATLVWPAVIGYERRDTLRRQLRSAIEGLERGTLTLDLSHVTFMDSMALGLLVDARDSCAASDALLVLSGLHAEGRKILQTAGLLGLFAFQDSVTGIPGDQLDTLPDNTPLPAEADTDFDQLAALAQRLLQVPTMLVSLVDKQQQVFPGAIGLPEPWQQQRSTPLSHSFCQYVVAAGQELVVTDARRHPVLRNSSAVPDLGVVAYAGVPLTDINGETIGSLCAIDSEPRSWQEDDLRTLRELAAVCSAELRARVTARQATLFEERSRLALELQHHITDELLTVAMDLARAQAQADPETAAVIDAVRQRVDAVLAATRDALYDSRPRTAEQPDG